MVGGLSSPEHKPAPVSCPCRSDWERVLPQPPHHAVLERRVENTAVGRTRIAVALSLCPRQANMVFEIVGKLAQVVKNLATTLVRNLIVENVRLPVSL